MFDERLQRAEIPQRHFHATYQLLFVPKHLPPEQMSSSMVSNFNQNSCNPKKGEIFNSGSNTGKRVGAYLGLPSNLAGTLAEVA